MPRYYHLISESIFFKKQIKKFLETIKFIAVSGSTYKILFYNSRLFCTNMTTFYVKILCHFIMINIMAFY